MEKYPWSAKQLRRLGEAIRDDVAAAPNVPDYGAVMAYFNDYASSIQTAIYDLDWDSLLQGRTYEVTSRPKTIDTLRQKLVRDPNTPLSNVQDVAGIRFEAEMTLDEQDAVAVAIAGLFNHSTETSLRDMRSDPHSGYRAVHIWLRSPARAEIQIRTHLQGKWANMYEAAADLLGREIRYGVLPQNHHERRLVFFLHAISRRIARHEEDYNEFNILEYHMEPSPLTVKRYARMRKNDVRRMRMHANRRRAHEQQRLKLRADEARIASDCEKIKADLEALLEDEEKRSWQDS